MLTRVTSTMPCTKSACDSVFDRHATASYCSAGSCELFLRLFADSRGGRWGFRSPSFFFCAAASAIFASASSKAGTCGRSAARSASCREDAVPPSVGPAPTTSTMLNSAGPLRKTKTFSSLRKHRSRGSPESGTHATCPRAASHTSTRRSTGSPSVTVASTVPAEFDRTVKGAPPAEPSSPSSSTPAPFSPTATSARHAPVSPSQRHSRASPATLAKCRPLPPVGTSHTSEMNSVWPRQKASMRQNSGTPDTRIFSSRSAVTTRRPPLTVAMLVTSVAAWPSAKAPAFSSAIR
mmetsp:Transcript_9850/g.28939  ORF Transcript_9850/g.28939 Transcript_9850/m.28939 type:complete len:293 (-) Transcript_9850:223-1101(-)